MAYQSVSQGFNRLINILISDFCDILGLFPQVLFSRVADLVYLDTSASVMSVSVLFLTGLILDWD
jgi:hypothetical protein